jgi:hypothetical protein
MEVPGAAKLPDLSQTKQLLAMAIVQLVWSEQKISQSFDVEYKGTDWKVTVGVKQTEDAPLRYDNEFMTNLPE